MPQEDLGYEAARMLDRLLRGKPLPSPMILPPVGVATRGSTDVVAVDDPKLARAVRFIRQRACDPCTVNDVVEELQSSRRWLELKFANHFGRTPHEEIVRVRMERARYLLRASRLPIHRIAERCGYPLLHNFGRAFKQAIGETPAAYRRRLRPRGLTH
jgi:LacI family transcriptional regulator